MSLILMSARFELLADGKRGRVVYSDGTKSAPFATQAMAAIVLDGALFSGRMNVHEAAFVAKHIEKSIKVVQSTELDRWCDEVSDGEEDQLKMLESVTHGFGTPQASMMS